MTIQPQRRRDAETDINLITGSVVDSAVNVHKNLGPGLLESIYEEALCYELHKRGVSFARQKAVRIPYENTLLNTEFRLDLLVEDQVIVELKCSEKLIPLYDAQLLTYLKITGCKVGLLLNFNVPLMKEGIRRVIL